MWISHWPGFSLSSLFEHFVVQTRGALAPRAACPSALCSGTVSSTTSPSFWEALLGSCHGADSPGEDVRRWFGTAQPFGFPSALPPPQKLGVCLHLLLNSEAQPLAAHALGRVLGFSSTGQNPARSSTISAAQAAASSCCSSDHTISIRSLGRKGSQPLCLGRLQCGSHQPGCGAVQGSAGFPRAHFGSRYLQAPGAAELLGRPLPAPGFRARVLNGMGGFSLAAVAGSFCLQLLHVRGAGAPQAEPPPSGEQGLSIS